MLSFFKRRSLRFEILLWFTLLFAGSTALIMQISYSTNTQSVINLAHKLMRESSDKSASQISAFFQLSEKLTKLAEKIFTKTSQIAEKDDRFDDYDDEGYFIIHPMNLEGKDNKTCSIVYLVNNNIDTIDNIKIIKAYQTKEQAEFWMKRQTETQSIFYDVETFTINY